MSIASVSGRNRARRQAEKSDREFYALTPEQRAERERRQREANERFMADPENIKTIRAMGLLKGWE
jgi:hypothetical protein